jgi:hypothetical protein
MRSQVYQAVAIAVAVTSVTIDASSSPSLAGGGRRISSLFGVVTNRHSQPSSSSSSSSSGSSSNSSIRQFLSSIPTILSTRGGGTNEIEVGGETKNIDTNGSAVAESPLYFPGLLDASVIVNGQTATNAVSDCYISITKSKANELKLAVIAGEAYLTNVEL